MRMRTTTYRCLQVMAIAMCTVSTLTFAQTAPKSMADVLFGVGWGDWCATAGLALSFGLVSLLQRFRRAEAGAHYGVFVAAHMAGSLISGVVVYLMTQGMLDSPNRFYQALAIGVAGWSGSAVADLVAARINKGYVAPAEPGETETRGVQGSKRE